MPSPALTEKKFEAFKQGMNDALAQLRDARLRMDALLAEVSQPSSEEEGD